MQAHRGAAPGDLGENQGAGLTKERHRQFDLQIIADVFRRSGPRYQAVVLKESLCYDRQHNHAHSNRKGPGARKRESSRSYRRMGGRRSRKMTRSVTLESDAFIHICGFRIRSLIWWIPMPVAEVAIGVEDDRGHRSAPNRPARIQSWPQ